MNDIIDSLRGKLAFAAFVGRSPLFVEAVRRLPCIAKDLAPVLIEGETGTGKELVHAPCIISGRAPDSRSRRSIAAPCRKRFLRTNCSAMNAAPSPTPAAAAKV
jgi:transcriptional regulator with PAS, ATPase and Fis domain